MELVDVPDGATAQRERFLGSPTLRVDGRDVEPGADARSDRLHAVREVQAPASLALRQSPSRELPMAFTTPDAWTGKPI